MPRGSAPETPIEQEIASRLAAGETPTTLIANNYKRSTVYKVLQRIRATTKGIPQPSWSVTVSPDPAQTYVLPGQAVVFNLSITNNKNTPLLVNQWGIAPSWLHRFGQWINRTDTFLLRSGEVHKCDPISIDVPHDLTLDEYDLRIGVMGQWLDPNTNSAGASILEWTDPLALHVQQKPMGIRIFLSSHRGDVGPIRLMARQLENTGFAAIIGRDLSSDQITRAILDSSIVVGFLTSSGVQSEEMEYELDLARNYNKTHLVIQLPGSPDAVNAILPEIINHANRSITDKNKAGIIAGSIIAGLLLIGTALSTMPKSE